MATLGRIEVKLSDRPGEGQKLLEEAYALNPGNVNVDAALGELAVKAGNDAKAIGYLIPARLSGSAPKTANEALESIYRKTHAGSPEQVKGGLEAMLDTEEPQAVSQEFQVTPVSRLTSGITSELIAQPRLHQSRIVG